MPEGMVQSAAAASELCLRLVWQALSAVSGFAPTSVPAAADVASRLALPSLSICIALTFCYQVGALAQQRKDLCALPPATCWLIMQAFLCTQGCDPLHCHQLLGQLKHLGIQVLDLLLQLFSILISLYSDVLTRRLPAAHKGL